MKIPYKRVVLLLTFTVQQNQTLLVKKVTEIADSKINSEKNHTKSLLPYTIITLVIFFLGFFKISFPKEESPIPQQEQNRLQEEQDKPKNNLDKPNQKQESEPHKYL